MKPVEHKVTATLPAEWAPSYAWVQRWLFQQALLLLIGDRFETENFRGRTIKVTLHEDGEHATAELVPLPPPEGIVPMDPVK